MTTSQIIILGAILILFYWSIFYRMWKDYRSEYQGNTAFELILFSITWAILVVMVFQVNDFNKTNKCPELEKVENVYKIK